MRILIDISETEEKENVYVNCDIPDHSIVIGNPCIIKHRENATEGYV